MKSIDDMTFDEINDILEKLLEKSNFAEINKLYSSAGVIARYDIIQYVYEHTDLADMEEFYLEKIKDKDRLIRCDIYDFLSESDNIDTFKVLLNRLAKEKSYIAMSYLLMAIGSVCRRNPRYKKLADTEKIKAYLSKEEHETAIPSYLVCLYVLTGDKWYLDEYWQYIDFEDDYHVRCSAVNQVYELADKSNYKKVYKAYKKRYENEDSIAVKSTLETAIHYLEEEFDIKDGT